MRKAILLVPLAFLMMGFSAENTPDEQAFAATLRKSLTTEPVGSQTEILPVREGVFSGSTDVGDVSWNVPTAQILTATWVPGTPAHTWQSTAASGMTIGQKGMLLAAKTLALTALDLVTDPKRVAEALAEFQKATNGRPYKTIHPERRPDGVTAVR